MSRYRIDAGDLEFAAEFLAAPVGYHSPGLQRVLNVLRGSGPRGLVANFDAASATLQIEQRPLRRYAGTPDRGAATLQVPTTAFKAAGAHLPLLVGAES